MASESIGPNISESAEEPEDSRDQKDQLFQLAAYESVKKWFQNDNYSEPRLGLVNVPEKVDHALVFYAVGGRAEGLIANHNKNDGRELELIRNSTMKIAIPYTSVRPVPRTDHWIATDYEILEADGDIVHKVWPNKVPRLVSKFRRNLKKIAIQNADLESKVPYWLGHPPQDLPPLIQSKKVTLGCPFCHRPVVHNAYKLAGMFKLAHPECVFAQVHLRESQNLAEVKYFEVMTHGHKTTIAKVSLSVGPKNKPTEARLRSICYYSVQCQVEDGCGNFYFKGDRHECFDYCELLTRALDKYPEPAEGQDETTSEESDAEDEIEPKPEKRPEHNPTDQEETDSDDSEYNEEESDNEQDEGEELNQEDNNADGSESEDEIQEVPIDPTPSGPKNECPACHLNKNQIKRMISVLQREKLDAIGKKEWADSQLSQARNQAALDNNIIEVHKRTEISYKEEIKELKTYIKELEEKSARPSDSTLKVQLENQMRKHEITTRHFNQLCAAVRDQKNAHDDEYKKEPKVVVKKFDPSDAGPSRRDTSIKPTPKKDKKSKVPPTSNRSTSSRAKPKPTATPRSGPKRKDPTADFFQEALDLAIKKPKKK